jgi:non-specific serine/threonine protein kinase
MAIASPPTFGALLRSLRRAAGLTQEQLAERAGLSVRGVSNLERGTRRFPYPHTVRQLAQVLRLSAADRARLEAAVPPRPARSARTTRPVTPAGNLPLPLTSFIGRQEQIVEVGHLLAAHRLVTLTGAGGVGKTRLALAVARDRAADYPDGVWLIELAALSDSALVPDTMARAVGLPGRGSRPAIDALVGWLSDRRVLLVLDNCEHLLDACASVAESLLSRCGQVRLLVTSRESLGLTGQVAWRVPSLATPPAHQSATPAEVRSYAAVRLFEERARAVQSRFALTDDNASAVAQVCSRLDGLPLAIELAAARLAALSVEQVAERLDDCFRLLTGGSRTALPRQQTLRATLDWSHALLTEPEQVLLRRLAVFTGGWTLDAAEAVSAGDGIAREAVLDLLTRLVSMSLVQTGGVASAARYQLLEIVRHYALDRLTEADGDADAVRDRHADWYLALVERATAGGRNASVGWADRLRPEWGNVSAALRWAAATGQVERALLASGALIELWPLTGQYTAPRALLAALLALPDAAAGTLGRARALLCAGELAWGQDDTTAAAAYLHEAIALCRAHDDRQGLGYTLVMAGWVVFLAGDAATGRAQLEEALPLVRAHGDVRDLGVALLFLGTIAYLQGEIARARAAQEEALPLARQSGNRRLITSVLHRLAQIAVAEGDYCLARARYVEQVPLIRSMGWSLAWTGVLRGLADLAAADGHPEQALRLAGAAERQREAAGVPSGRLDHADVAGRLATCRTALGEEAAAAAWAAGQALTSEQALAEGLAATEALANQLRA